MKNIKIKSMYANNSGNISICSKNEISKKGVGFIPAYAIKPLLLMLAINVLSYYATLPYTKGRFHYDLSTTIDHKIPFVSIFIIPYILAYAQWVIGYICISKESEKRCEEICYGEIISKLIVGFIFIVMPTTMARPAIENGGIFNRMVALIYASDPSTNLFPSIHCLESWICLKASFSSEYFPKWYKFTMFITSIFVFMSTVFVKQHVIVDVAGGIFVAEIGLAISRKLHSRNLRKNSRLPVSEQ